MAARKKIFVATFALSVAVVLTALMLGEAYFFLREPASKSAYVSGLRSAGHDAWPAVTPQIILTETGFAGFPAASGALLPLGGISRVHTVFCRESGGWLEYRSDRFGFHNDDAIWDSPQFDAAVVGDSFAQGACIPSQDNLASVLSSRWSKTVNLGSFGNGPLGGLATMVEYLKTKRPRHVFWLYVTNDLGIDLGIERGSQSMRQYLVPGWTQRLTERQAEIDSVLKNFLNERMKREGEREKMSTLESVQSRIALTSLRRAIRLAQDERWRPAPPTEPQTADYDRFHSLDWRLYTQTLTSARELVKGWGGSLHVVIIPDARMFGGYAPIDAGIEPELFVAELARRIKALGLGVIDLRATFAKLPNPLSHYAMMHGFYGHFDREGSWIAARAILEQVSNSDP